MAKVSMPISNDYCPQTLFVYGTFREDGKPNFGLFCWISYCWDSELGVMACIGGSKLTLDRIRATKVFSANLVTESVLPLCDYFGTREGRDPGKMDVPFEWERGAVLDVPVLSGSPVAFELEVKSFAELDDGTVMLCRIRNVLVDEQLADDSMSPEQKLAAIAPVSTTCMTYFGWDGRKLGGWNELAGQIKGE